MLNLILMLYLTFIYFDVKCYDLSADDFFTSITNFDDFSVLKVYVVNFVDVLFTYSCICYFYVADMSLLFDDSTI